MRRYVRNGPSVFVRVPGGAKPQVNQPLTFLGKNSKSFGSTTPEHGVTGENWATCVRIHKINSAGESLTKLDEKGT